MGQTGQTKRCSVKQLSSEGVDPLGGFVPGSQVPDLAWLMVSWSLSNLLLLASLLMCLVSLASPGPGALRSASLQPPRNLDSRNPDSCSWFGRIASSPRPALSLRGGNARMTAAQGADLASSHDHAFAGGLMNDSQQGKDVAAEPEPPPLRAHCEQPTKVHADPTRGCDQTVTTRPASRQPAPAGQ